MMLVDHALYDPGYEDSDLLSRLAVVWQNCKDCMSNGMESPVQISEKQGINLVLNLFMREIVVFSAYAQAFVKAIKKNQAYQKFLHDKLIEVEARLEENKKLRERIKFLKGF
nr:myb domain protein 4r1 [Tanacetum cinerariifolium]